jgi:hypothetical protein
VLVCQNSQLREGANNQKSTLKRAFAKAIRKLTSQYQWEKRIVGGARWCGLS